MFNFENSNEGAISDIMIHSTTQHNTTQHNTIQRSMVQYRYWCSMVHYKTQQNTIALVSAPTCNSFPERKEILYEYGLHHQSVKLRMGHNRSILRQEEEDE